MRGLSGQDLSGEVSRRGASMLCDSSCSDKGYSRSPRWQKLYMKNIVAQPLRSYVIVVFASLSAE